MVQTLTGPRFARALRAGALAVVREQETLNRINVFPVPDADTGANLASTLRAAAAAMVMPNIVTVGQSARAAADAALDGARGNSGAILAQFFHGLAEVVGNRAYLTTRDFAAAVRRGVDAAYQALQHPTEGTILSVLRTWAASLEERAQVVADFADLLAHGLARARDALAETPRQLAVLAKHGVVDAGAQGFVYFLEGISAIFRDRRAADWTRAGLSPQQPTPFAAAHAEVDDTYRYCAEGLITGTRLDRKAVAAAVSPLGNSLVVAGGGARLRVHLHTNEPQRFFNELASFGKLERTKTDDMVLQQLAGRGVPIALVTDSGCDLPEAVAYRFGLVRVPFTFRLGEESFLDGVDITPPQFYQRLATSNAAPSTSQPAVGDFKRTFARLLDTHEGVVAVTISSALSGTYQAAVAAAGLVDPSRIRVVDSRGVSVAAGLVAEAAGEAILAGKSLDEVERLARAAAASVRLYAALPSLDTAVRGGRVPARIARASRLFHLKPILSLDEHGATCRSGVALGFRQALKGLYRRAVRWAGGAPARFLIAHASAVGAAEYVAEQLRRYRGATDIPLVNLAPVLAAHTGPGAVGVAVRRESP
ncbi:MAG: DegV family EDD domain-containing protein [Thermoanaerobaculaceae bacterium]|nr:DegV family EDD domain-containing protein [Thermoanaerobaculaceae bacterium]